MPFSMRCACYSQHSTCVVLILFMWQLNPDEQTMLLGGEMAMWTDDYCFVSECFLYKRAKPVAWWMYGPDADSQFTESVSGIVSIDHIIIIVTVSKELLELYNSPLSIQWVQFGVNTWVRINFSKITKLHKPLGQLEFVVFEKFTSAYDTKLQEKSCYYLSIVSTWKNITESQDRQNFEKFANTICKLHLCYNFALVLTFHLYVT